MTFHPLPNRRQAMASLALLAGSGPAVWAQEPFPARPVRLVVGFAPGTGPDILARLLAHNLSQQWGGASVVVQNTAGAAGMIATQEVARAAPDGYTLLLGTTGLLSIAPSTHSKLAYDPAKDFVPVSLAADSEFVLLVNPQKVPARNLGEFMAWAKNQRTLFMGTFGAGTAGHFGAYILGDAIQVKPEVVHYRTTGDALTGLHNGDIQGVFASVGLAAPQSASGKLVALASTGSKRSSKLSSVPTFAEAGHASISFTSWFGLVAPAGTPAAVVGQIRAAAQKAVQAAQAGIEQAGFIPVGSTGEEFSRTIAADTQMWAKAVRATGFRADP